MMNYVATDTFEYVIIGHEVAREATVDEEANLLEPEVLGERFLVNARGEIPESWQPFKLSNRPSSPRHVFGSDDQCFFRFATEAEFRHVEPKSEYSKATRAVED